MKMGICQGKENMVSKEGTNWPFHEIYDNHSRKESP